MKVLRKYVLWSRPRLGVHNQYAMMQRCLLSECLHGSGVARQQT